MHKRVEQTIASLHIWGGSGPPTTLEFDIDQPGGSSLPGAKITISYNSETVTKTANNKGLAIFYEVPTNIDIPYTVIASGYADYTGSVNIAPGEYGWVNVEMAEPVLTFIVKDRETGVGIANAYVYLRDGNHQMLMQLGITDSNGILTLSGLTLEPGEYYFDASASGYEALLLGYPFTVTDSSPITATIKFELQKGFVFPPTE